VSRWGWGEGGGGGWNLGEKRTRKVQEVGEESVDNK